MVPARTVAANCCIIWRINGSSWMDCSACRARSITGLPYCTHHAEIAYQPAAERKRDRRVASFR